MLGATPAVLGGSVSESGAAAAGAVTMRQHQCRFAAKVTRVDFQQLRFADRRELADIRLSFDETAQCGLFTYRKSKSKV